LSSDPFLGARIKEGDLKELDGILIDEERLQAVFSGGVAGQLSIKMQWLVLTDKRVIFYARALIGGGSDTFYYDEISSVEGRKGLALGSIELNIKGKTESFINMQKKEVDQAVDLIRRNIEESKRVAPVPAADPFEQIKKLKDLLDSGIITQEEFEEKKKKLLEKV